MRGNGVVRWIVTAICAGGTSAAAANDLELPEVRVGMEGTIELLLSGPLLETREVDRRAPVLVHIASSRPHGSKTDYEVRFIGFEPGEYDLREYLHRRDGSALEPLAPILVRVTGVLPDDHDGALVPVQTERSGLFSPYGAWVTLAGVAWVGLMVPMIWRRCKRRLSTAEMAEKAPPTLAERMAPLLQAAAAGSLDQEGRARLERMLLSYWRERTGVVEMPMDEAWRQMRRHPEAGRVVEGLEAWLHRPGNHPHRAEEILSWCRELGSEEQGERKQCAESAGAISETGLANDVK